MLRATLSYAAEGGVLSREAVDVCQVAAGTGYHLHLDRAGCGSPCGLRRATRNASSISAAGRRFAERGTQRRQRFWEARVRRTLPATRQASSLLLQALRPR